MLIIEFLLNEFKKSKWNAVAFYTKIDPDKEGGKPYAILSTYKSFDPYVCLQTEFKFGYSGVGKCGDSEQTVITENTDSSSYYKIDISDKTRSEIDIPCIGIGNEL